MQLGYKHFIWRNVGRIAYKLYKSLNSNKGANIMGLFNFFQTKKPYKFLSEREFKSNLSKQLSMTPQTLKQLRKYGVGENKELSLEYFFYTDTIDKAKELANELGKLNYKVKFEKSTVGSGQFLVTGWTIKMTMSQSIVLAWTKQMCETGYKYDCDFDGWGTNPDQ